MYMHIARKRGAAGALSVPRCQVIDLQSRLDRPPRASVPSPSARAVSLPRCCGKRSARIADRITKTRLSRRGSETFAWLKDQNSNSGLDDFPINSLQLHLRDSTWEISSRTHHSRRDSPSGVGIPIHWLLENAESSVPSNFCLSQIFLINSTKVWLWKFWKRHCAKKEHCTYGKTYVNVILIRRYLFFGRCWLKHASLSLLVEILRMTLHKQRELYKWENWY